MQAPALRCYAVAVVLGFSLLSISNLVAESRNFPGSSNPLLSPASGTSLTEAVAALPSPVPVMIAPVANAPALIATKPMTKQMQKLALRYDVAKIGDRKVGTGMNFYPIEKEAELGRTLSEEVEQSVVFVNDPTVTEYVNRLAQNLARNSDAKVGFAVQVVNSAEVNAFALPGGYFYVNAGLILAADNEAELAGVMAHEIAHVAARHATHNLSRRSLLALCALPTVFVAGPVGIAMTEASQMAQPLAFLKFSRDAEREADLLGMEYMYATGYDPAAMVSFFEKAAALEKRQKGYLARAFDTHPMTSDRVKRAQDVMSAMLPAKSDYKLTTSEFNDVKARLEALVNYHAEERANPLPTLHKSVGSGDDAAELPKKKRPTLKGADE